MIPLFLPPRVLGVIGACCLALARPVSAQSITNGVILLHKGEQVPCKMIKLNKRKEEEALVYNQVQVIDSTGTRTYLPADLLGYVKDGVVYKTFIDDGYALFGRCLVEDGKTTLFYHPGGYGEGKTRNGKRYFFKKKTEQGFMEINSITTFPRWVGVPETPAMTMGGGPYSGSNALPSLPIKNKDTRFIDFFSEYFKDCQAVVRKIKMEFYTIDDIQSAFEEFNACSPGR